MISSTEIGRPSRPGSFGNGCSAVSHTFTSRLLDILLYPNDNNHRHSKKTKKTTHGMQDLCRVCTVCRTIRNRVGTELLYRPASLYLVLAAAGRYDDPDL